MHSGWSKVFFWTCVPKLYIFGMQKWGTEIKMSEITWGLCCRSPDFLLPQTEDLQHMPWHIAKRHFGCLQTLIDMLRLNWKPE